MVRVIVSNRGDYMNRELFVQAITKFLLGVFLVGALLFIPAGTFRYPNAWMFMGFLFIPMFIVGIILMFVNPKLLKSRLDAKESENEQKIVVAISGIMFIAGFIVSGLNFRYEWIELPDLVVVLSTEIFIIAYIMYAEVLRENAFLSRTIKVAKKQKLIDTGLYGIVRHPMYLATVFMFLSIPLILGSIQAFLIFLIYPFVIVKRIKNEEKVLEKQLIGYKKYETKVKYRLIPYIW
jgi:protein-S-isoprenylcysteine O-methyltransferase Ste14